MPWFFKKMLDHRCLTRFWIFFRFWIYQDSKYAKVTQDSWKILLTDAWQDSKYSSGSKYGRVLNMSELHEVLNKTHHYRYLIVFFVSGFSFIDTDDWQDSRGREGTIFYSMLPFPPLTNIQTFICNFACEMTITYF